MSPVTYADTSVIAAYYCPETLSDRAERALMAAEAVGISTLTEVELASAVSRKVRDRELGKPDAVRILDRFRLHVAQGLYQRLPLDTVHYETARDWLSRFTIVSRTLDALHLAVAFQHEAVLLTADARQAEAARRIGMKADLVAED